jgi:hypothetical protein
MTKNETLTQQEETQLKSVFSSIRQAEVEAPVFLKARVLAHLKDDRKQRHSLFFWKALSAGSLFSLIFLGVFSFNLYKKSPTDGITQQAYVIHIDFNQADKNVVANAEIELPKDVHFVSSKKEIREESKLTLPVDIKVAGRGKLPFVVTSEFSGEKEIKVRLLDENNQLVREQVLKLKFAKQGSSITF